MLKVTTKTLLISLSSLHYTLSRFFTVNLELENQLSLKYFSFFMELNSLTFLKKKTKKKQQQPQMVTSAKL